MIQVFVARRVSKKTFSPPPNPRRKSNLHFLEGTLSVVGEGVIVSAIKGGLWKGTALI